MQCKRIISKFEIKGPNLVKGVNLEGMRALGKPELFSKVYYQENIDEIFYQDTVASLYNRNSLYDLIKDVSKDIFIPLNVGGGVKNKKDIFNLFKAGADKVSINKQAIKKPNFLYESVKQFGSANICVSIEAVWYKNDYYCFFDNGRNNSGIKVTDWIKKLEKINIGEIILTFVDLDGTGKGFDLNVINKISQLTNIPIIICGGCGNKLQILELFKKTKCSGVSISSMFHYFYINHNKIVKKNLIQNEGNFDYLKEKRTIKKINDISINKLKYFLKKNKINCRL